MGKVQIPQRSPDIRKGEERDNKLPKKEIKKERGLRSIGSW